MWTVHDVVQAVYRKDIGTLAALTRDEVNLTGADGRTPLLHAVLAEDADPAVVASLIDCGADVRVADREQRWTALHFAARDQYGRLTRLLLDAGAEVDAVDVFGNTPLWRAVMNVGDDLGTVAVLVEHGADPRRANAHGISPLDLAHETQRDDVVTLLERRPPGSSR